MAYAEFDACIAAGLDIAKWQSKIARAYGYTKELKTQVMAWHRIDNLIAAHVEQAVTDKARKK